MRKYIVSPVTGLAVAGMVGGVSAMSAAGGVYRVGFINEAGEVPWYGDFRLLGFAAAVGFNLLPRIGSLPVVGPFLDGPVNSLLGTLEGLPVVGAAFGDVGQDYAALLGGASLISYAATEGVGVKETGQFMGLSMPAFVMDFLGEGAPALPDPVGPTEIPVIQEVMDVA